MAGTRDADYLAMNPNARIPTLVDGDYVLWESNSIMRYLCPRLWRRYADLSEGAEAAARPSTAGSTGRCRRCSRSTARCSGASSARPPEQRNWPQLHKDAETAAEIWHILDRQLATRRFVEGDDFTIADIALGAYARRWLGVEGITRPAAPHLERWRGELDSRPGFKTYVAPPMS